MDGRIGKGERERRGGLEGGERFGKVDGRVGKRDTRVRKGDGRVGKREGGWKGGGEDLKGGEGGKGWKGMIGLKRGMGGLEIGGLGGGMGGLGRGGLGRGRRLGRGMGMGELGRGRGRLAGGGEGWKGEWKIWKGGWEGALEGWEGGGLGRGHGMAGLGRGGLGREVPHLQHLLGCLYLLLPGEEDEDVSGRLTHVDLEHGHHGRVQIVRLRSLEHNHVCLSIHISVSFAYFGVKCCVCSSPPPWVVCSVRLSCGFGDAGGSIFYLCGTPVLEFPAMFFYINVKKILPFRILPLDVRIFWHTF